MRLRLLALVLAVLVPLIAGAGWLLFEAFGKRLVQDINVALEEEAETIGELVGAPQNRDALADLVAQVSRDTEFGASKFIVVRRDQEVIAEAPRESLAMLRAEGAKLQVVRYRSPASGVEVTIGVRDAGARQAMHRLGSLLVLGVPILIILTATGLWVVMGRALRPLEVAARHLQNIGAKDLSVRMPVDNPEDEVGRLVRALNSALDRVEGSVTELRRFTGDAAHALRTPLTVLRAGLDVALAQDRPAADYRAALVEAVASTERMTRIADRLLTLSRLEAAGAISPGEPVEIGDMLRELADAFGDRVAEGGMTVEVEAGPDLWVRGEPADLYRLFSDLIDNAVRYGRSAVKKPSAIHLAALRRDGWIRITVADEGPGIGAGDLPYVFERFYRGHAQRPGVGGTGLGLSIALQVARAYAGEIQISNRAEGGCLVTVMLPELTNPARDCAF